MKEVIFVTYSKLPKGTADDQLVVPFLEKSGVNLSFIDWHNFSDSLKDSADLVVLRSPWDYIFSLDKFLDFTKSFDRNLLNEGSLVLWNHHKGYLKEVASKGLRALPCVGLEEWIHNQSHFKSVGEKIVIKPYVSASSFETVVCEQGIELSQKVLEWAKERPRDFFVQPFCESIKDRGELSFVFFNHRDRGPQFSHACLKTPKSGDFRVQEEFGGRTESYKPGLDEVTYAQGYLETLKNYQWLYTRVDLVFYEGQWCLSELECIEPDLYFKTAPQAPELFTNCLISFL